MTLLITFWYEPYKNTASIVIVQQYLNRCIETGVCLFAYCTATAVVYSHHLPTSLHATISKQTTLAHSHP
jgi:hypothetical protein